MNGNGNGHHHLAIRLPIVVVTTLISAGMGFAIAAVSWDHDENREIRQEAQAMADLTSQVRHLAIVIERVETSVNDHIGLSGHPLTDQRLQQLESVTSDTARRLDGLVGDITEVKANQRAIIGMLQVLRDPVKYGSQEFLDSRMTRE